MPAHVGARRFTSGGVRPAYYVDATYGSDSNGGLTAALPWQTINKVNTTALIPGARVLFKRGEIWREMLTKAVDVGAYGSKDIGYFTGYGPGAQRNVTAEYLRWVVRASGALYMFSERSSAGVWYIHLHTTPDDGISWYCRAATALLAAGGGGTFDEHGQADPSVLYEDSTWKMWYDAQDVSNNWWGLGYATSSDGLSWTKSLSNPILSKGTAGAWDDDFVHHPCVIKDGSTYYMYYAGSRAGGNYSIGLATSTDGIAWTKYAGNPVIPYGSNPSADYAHCRPAKPFYLNGLWHMPYWGKSAWVSPIDTIMHATSPDLLTWTKHGVYFTGTLTGSELKGVQANCVLDENGFLRMWYGQANGSGAVGSAYAWNSKSYPNAATINAPARTTGWTWTADNAIGYLTPGATRLAGANLIYGIKITVGASDVKATAIKFYSYLPSTANIKAAIYTYDSATAGTLVANSQSAQIAADVYMGWNTLTIAGQPTLTAGASYWLAIWASAAHNCFSNAHGSPVAVYKAAVFDATWPASFTGGTAETYESPCTYLVTDAASSNIYKVTGVASDPAPVYQDLTALTVGASATALTTGQYFWDGADVLYIRCTDDGDPNVDKIISYGSTIRQL